jgi:hypothetical protein
MHPNDLFSNLLFVILKMSTKRKAMLPCQILSHGVRLAIYVRVPNNRD